MKYTIIVDKQNSANPSSEKRQYVLNIDPLKTYNGISDVLMITVERTYIIRKISVTKYGVPTIMPYPQEEELSKIKINLFEGDNYIYILDEIGNTIIATFILKNDFTDTFPSKVEMNTQIEQTASNIEISVDKKLEDYSTTEEMRAEIKLESDEINIEVSKKVGKNEVISSINLTEEEATIKAEKISLEGLVTVNQKFKVLEDGSIEATDGKFTGDIYLDDGGKVIGGDGLYTNLQYISQGMRGEGGFSSLGIEENRETPSNVKSYLQIYADIPSGFVITSAKITLMHQPINWGYHNTSTTSSWSFKTGYARNIGIFKGDIPAKVTAYVDSGIYEESPSASEISGALGTSGWTPSSTATQTKVSTDIKSYLNVGSKTRIIIQTRNDVPSYNEGDLGNDNTKNIISYTGSASAVLDVIGYMSPN